MIVENDRMVLCSTDGGKTTFRVEIWHYIKEGASWTNYEPYYIVGEYNDRGEFTGEGQVPEKYVLRYLEPDEPPVRTVELNEWEIKELLHYAEAGEDMPMYDDPEKERWRALAKKLKVVKEEFA